jgi:hypothetical protein
MPCHFEHTNVEELDRILYAIEVASDLFHNTSSWDTQWDGSHYGFEGDTPNEWIQNEINKSKAAIKKLKKHQNKWSK